MEIQFVLIGLPKAIIIQVQKRSCSPKLVIKRTLEQIKLFTFVFGSGTSKLRRRHNSNVECKKKFHGKNAYRFSGSSRNIINVVI